jgi:molybdopterin biosynthesis enzyme
LRFFCWSFFSKIEKVFSLSLVLTLSFLLLSAHKQREAERERERERAFNDEMPESAAAPPPRQPSAAYKMVSIPFAQHAALDSVSGPLPSSAAVVPLQQALGRVLAEDLVATSPLPPFAASIKDGYAVRSSDLVGAFERSRSGSATAAAGGADDDASALLVFPVAFEALAGASPPPLPANSVAYISTGAPLPEGADAVVQIEDTEEVKAVEVGEGGGGGGGGGGGSGGRGRRRVRFSSILESKTSPPRPGDDVRAPGSDLSPGTVVLSAGEVIGPAEIGLAATVGVGALRVRARPLVAVLSTGDELLAAAAAAAASAREEEGKELLTVPPSSPLPPGAIRDANRPLLLAAAAAEGSDVLDLGVAGDGDEGQQTEAAVDRALREGAHVLVVSGGVSMGERVGGKEVEVERKFKRRKGGGEEEKLFRRKKMNLSIKTKNKKTKTQKNIRRPRLCQARSGEERHGALWPRQHEAWEAADFRDASTRGGRGTASLGVWVRIFFSLFFFSLSLSFLSYFNPQSLSRCLPLPN